MKALTKNNKETLKSLAGRLIKLTKKTRDVYTKQVLAEASSMLVRLLVLSK